MTNEEKALVAWWKEWDANVFGPWAKKPPTPAVVRAPWTPVPCYTG